MSLFILLGQQTGFLGLISFVDGCCDAKGLIGVSQLSAVLLGWLSLSLHSEVEAWAVRVQEWWTTPLTSKVLSFLPQLSLSLFLLRPSATPCHSPFPSSFSHGVAATAPYMRFLKKCRQLKDQARPFWKMGVWRGGKGQRKREAPHGWVDKCTDGQETTNTEYSNRERTYFRAPVYFTSKFHNSCFPLNFGT